MKFFRKLHVCFFLFSFFANAEVSINFPITSEGYWYCKAYSNLSFYNSSLSYELCLKACDDLSALSPAETICFLSGILDNDSSAYKKILFWNSLKKIKIPKEDLIYLKKMNEIFKISFLKHKEIFEKIKKFWGVKKDCRVYCFLSTSGSMGYTGAWIANFHEKDRVLCTIFLNLPPTERSIDEYMSMIAHEFSHAMCDVAYGRIKFATLTKTLKSKNAVVAGWYMNEVLAILLGNCIAQESFLKKKVDPNK